MENWSQVFQETIDEFESPYVAGDQGDAGKGQVLVRAGYRITTTLDPRVGYISKNPGQTQFYGAAVDALTDSVDGSGADFLTDEPQADGRRLIRGALTPYAVAPPASPPRVAPARFGPLDAAHAEIIATSNANTEAIQTQIHDLVEDAEATFIL